MKGAVETPARGAAVSAIQPSSNELTTSEVRLDLITSFVPAAARADLPVGSQKIEPDHLIEVEFEHGERLWMRGDDFRITFADETKRDAIGQDLEVPLTLGLASRGLETRGPVAWAIKSLKVFGVDLEGKTAEFIGRRVDFPTQPSKKRQIPGHIYRCNPETSVFDLTKADISAAAVSEPWLLFIHGTLSSTWGSFGELWSESRRAELAILRAAYGDRIIAFEHATLTESPVRNAIELVKQLPVNAKLHVVSHSRGGLVGELLCRSRVVTHDPAGSGNEQPPVPAFTEEQLDAFGSSRHGAAVDREADVAALQSLQALFNEKQITVDRFVRVACPALGTTLASGRVDRWLSVIGTVAGAAIPGTPLNDLFKDIGDFIAAVVKQRTDPATLPGLEAQMPDAPLIRLLNWPGVRVHGDLAVIAGDIEPNALWARLVVWLSDRFYEGDHDLVVNTPSMWGGARRAGLEIVSAHKGPTVNHFSYFAEQDSARRLVAALTTKESSPQGFEPLKKPAKPIARAAVDSVAATAGRPVLFVLPGIMGSQLADDGGPVWVELPSLLRGGLTRLKIDAKGIRPTDPIARYYSALIHHLAGTHNVVPFPYDWRVRVTDEADRLAAAVRQSLDSASRVNQPVRFLAHSMGGLVVRAMIASHPALWREVCAHEGGRLVMLGTPNGGSHAITELLVGQSSVLRKLARLDIRNSPQELLAIVSRFPGVLAMLPRGDKSEDFFSIDTWQAYHRRAGNDDRAGWSVPLVSDLAEARKLRDLLDNAPVDPNHMIYVAGSADVTVAGMKFVFDPSLERDRIEFLATTRGDGRVTWDSGILANLPTWYMDVEHGQLAAHPPAFAAIQELLEHGTTTRLDKDAPVARAVGSLFPMPPPSDDRFPDDEDLAATVLGAGSRTHRSPERREPPLRVRIVHGNLAFSRHIVAVGHYAGDSIVSAEKALDRALDGALSRRLQMGLYPGPLETNAVFANRRAANPRFLGLQGALVVGLGTVGALSASQLTRTFARALLEYTLERSKQPASSGADSRNLGVSTLLIGTGAGGTSVKDSVYALIRGAMSANDTLRTTNQQERIATLEFMELWQDRAIQALDTLHLLSTQAGMKTALQIDATLDERDGRLQRLSYEDEAPEWWQRLQIKGRAGDGDGLRFTAVTTRARTEVRLLSTQRRLVDQFIERALAETRNDRAVARTLFDLLLPNELKELAPVQDDVVLLLDEESARYPWELLEDGLRPGQKPWAIEHGILRQLESEQFRQTVRSVTENTALIIGDPVSNFAELKGAQSEAEAVWRTLQRGFVPFKYLRPTSAQVVRALFDRPYKVVHLAGHGVYRYIQPGDADPSLAQSRRAAPISGMVIGDGMFLTPAEVQQMRAVPDLVFINCCHLGRVEDSTVSPQGSNVPLSFPGLAANLATEFIRMGVRAVVAAGWAVDDAAAATFATTFYDEMLKGRPFGDAIKIARQFTYERYPASNTWGAYQCYGDPDYRLVTATEVGPHDADDSRLRSTAQVVQDLSNIAARLKTGATESRAREIESIQRIAKTARDRQPNWMHNGSVLSALARAYAEAGDYGQAVQYYTQALSAEDGSISVADIEQLANMEVRDAFQKWDKGGRPQATEALHVECVTQITRAIGILNTLRGETLGAITPPHGETSERLSLLAAAYKRLALVQTGDARLDALRWMTDNYRRAAQIARDRDGDVAYPLINAVAAALALDRLNAGGATPMSRDEFTAGVLGDLADVRAAIARQLERRPAFWLYSMTIDADLLETLATAKMDREQAKRIADGYLDYRHVGSEREFGSVFTQIDFLIAVLSGLDARAQLEALRRDLEEGAKS